MGEVKARHVAAYDQCERPGDYFITEPNPHDGGMRRLSFMCPCGCGDLCGIRIRDDGQNVGGAWGWNGDMEKPTATPSIAIGPGQHWHGFLTDGVFRSV
jgi:hypothetical protein